MTNKTCTVVYGPQGCGKTTNADAIAKAYGCHKIVDTGVSDMGMVKPEKLGPGVLVLCTEDPDLSRARFDFPLRVVTYKVAMEMVKIDEEGRA